MIQNLGNNHETENFGESFYNQLELLVILIVMAFLHVYELGEKKNIVFWLKNWGCFFFLKQCNSFKQFQLSQDVLKIRQGFVNYSKVCPYWFF